MDWLVAIGNLIAHIPIERVLFPPRDNTKALEEFAAGMKPTGSPKETSAQQKTVVSIAVKPAVTVESPQGTSTAVLPTTEETTAQLKRRLAKELYKLELDLAGGMRTAGKPCDCLNSKHSLLFESVAEELIPLDPHNSIYSEVLAWVNAALPKGTFEAISSGRYDAEYPLMASEMRDFRKRIMGTTSLTAMIEPKEQVTLEEAKKLAAQEAEKEVERKWQSQEKKLGK